MVHDEAAEVRGVVSQTTMRCDVHKNMSKNHPWFRLFKVPTSVYQSMDSFEEEGRLVVY
jgi:hypothetical protein